MLKEQFDGIKLLEVISKHEPFFNGGRIGVSFCGRLLFSLFQESLFISNWETGVLISKLLGSSNEDDDTDEEGISCFCVSPMENKIVVATKRDLIKLFEITINLDNNITSISNECLKVIRAHSLPVTSIAFDSSGTLVATGSTDNTVKVWDISKGYCTHVFKQNKSTIRYLYFHPSAGNFGLFSCSDDSAIKYFDLNANSCRASFHEHFSTPTEMSMSHCGLFLVTAGRDKVLNFYDLTELSHLKTVLTSDVLESVQVWNMEDSKRFLRQFYGNDHDMFSLPEGDSHATFGESTDSGANNKGDSKKKKSLNKKKRHAQTSAHIHYIVVAGGELGTIHVFHVSYNSNHFKDTFSCVSLGQVALNPNPPEVRVAHNTATESALRDHQLWYKILKSAALISSYTKSIAALTSANKTSSVAAGSAKAADKTFSTTVHLPKSPAIRQLVYLPATGQLVVTTADHHIQSLDIAPPENVIHHSHPNSHTAALLPLNRQLSGFNDDILDMHALPPLSSEFSSGELSSSVAPSFIPKLGFVTNSSQVQLMDKSFHSRSLYGHSDIVLAMDLSPDGQWLSTSSKDNTLRIWNLLDLSHDSVPMACGVGKGHTDAVGAIALSRNPYNYTNKLSFMISGANDKILKKWELPCDVLKDLSAENRRLYNHHVGASGPCSSDFQHNESSQHASNAYEVRDILEFINNQTQSSYYDLSSSSSSSSSSSAASSSYSRTRILFPRLLLHLTCLKSVKAHEKDISALATSPNDVLIATGSQDKTVKLWSSDNLMCLATLSGHKRGVWKVVFSPIDKVVVSASGDRTLRLWSTNDYSCLRTLQGHTASVLSVQYVPTGLQLVSTAADGLLRLWTIRTGECEGVFDGHIGKVWALAWTDVRSSTGSKFPPAGGGDDTNEPTSISAEARHRDTAGSASKQVFYTGGSDSTICMWQDVTEAAEVARLQALEEEILMEQQLQNDLSHKRYDKALSKALALGHSHRVLTILKNILEEYTKAGAADNDEPPDQRALEGDLSYGIIAKSATSTNPNSFLMTLVQSTLQTAKKAKLSVNSSPSPVLDDCVRSWTRENMNQVATYIRDWFTNSKNSYLCTMLLDSIIRVHGVRSLAEIANMKSIVTAWIAYAERHAHRIRRLHESAFLSEYVLSLMTNFPTDIPSPTSMGTSKLAGPDALEKRAAVEKNACSDPQVNGLSRDASMKRRLAPVIFASEGAKSDNNKRKKSLTRSELDSDDGNNPEIQSNEILRKKATLSKKNKL